MTSDDNTTLLWHITVQRGDQPATTTVGPDDLDALWDVFWDDAAREAWQRGARLTLTVHTDPPVTITLEQRVATVELSGTLHFIDPEA